LAKIDGPYPEFSGSPASQGLLQFDLWNVKPPSAITTTTHFSYADNDIALPWDELRADIVKFGARNSLLTALMPTAGTSVITGCAESFEPLSKIFFKRRLGRDFFILNAAFQQDMRRLGLMGEELINHLTLSDGEVSGITGLPAIIRKIYRTVNDVGEETCLEMAADRGPFVDQSQSSNIYIKEASIRRLAALLIKAWKLGLKTGSYYCRSKATTTRQNYGMTQDEESKYTTFDASSIVSRTSKVSKNEFDYLISDTSMATLGNDVCESCSS
jgi:ribonucleoside-diphosphate reductase subunit M1